MLRGYLLFRAHKWAEAEDLITIAAKNAHAEADYEVEADAELLLCAKLLDPSAREEAGQKALQIATSHSLYYQQAGALLNLGMVRVKRQLWGDAIPYFERASEIAQRIQASEVRSMAMENIATCYYNMGDVERALKNLLSFVDYEKQHGLPTTQSKAYIELGNVYLLQKATAKAIECFQQAQRLIQEKDNSDQAVLIASNLVQALEMAGLLDEAERNNDRAFSRANKQDREQLAFLTINKAVLAEDRGRYQDAIQFYTDATSLGKGIPSVLWEAYAGLGRVFAKTGEQAKAEESFERALEIIDGNRSEQLHNQYKITFLTARIRFYQDYVSLLMSKNKVQKALEIADSSRAGVLNENLNGRISISRRHLFPQLQKIARLGGCTFLFYWLAPTQSYLWVIGQEQMKAVPLADERLISQEVDSYRHLIEHEKQDPVSVHSKVGIRLFQMLVAPAADLLPKGGRVVIIPDGSLHNLNFETLLVDEAAPHYWLQDITLSVAPSLGIMRLNDVKSQSERSLLLIGNPDFSGTGFSELPQAAAEIEAVKHHFQPGKATVYTGLQASGESYRTAHPERFSIIHFTTHAEANAESPLDSAIVLSAGQNGYKLYARDVMQWPLRADLVTISACQGVGARRLSGEGIVGFAWAFFQAGARNIVTSLWDVDDRSSAESMEQFYSGIESGKPYGDALREAKRAMLLSRYSEPYYWAPFQLYSRSIDVLPAMAR